jgi:hypothetical protein
MSTRPLPESARFELEYWRAILEDMAALSDGVRLTAEHTAEVPVCVLEALLLPEAQRADHLVRASTAARDAMNELAKLHGPLARMVSLVEGRLAALTGETPECDGSASCRASVHVPGCFAGPPEQHSVRVDP